MGALLGEWGGAADEVGVLLARLREMREARANAIDLDAAATQEAASPRPTGGGSGGGGSGGGGSGGGGGGGHLRGCQSITIDNH